MKNFYSLSKVEQLAFPGAQTNHRDPPNIPNSESIWLTANDNHGDWISGILAHANSIQQKKYCVIHFYGQHESLNSCEYFVEAIRSCKTSVLIFDYRGYGTSRGRPKESSFYADALLIYDWLKERYPDYRVIASGWGLGTAVASYLAQYKETDGLILFSPPTSMVEVVSHVFKDDQVFIEEAMPFVFDNLERIRKLRCPILMIHGTHDTTIPYQMSQRLQAAVRSSLTRLDIPDAGYMDLFLRGGGLLWQGVFQFIQTVQQLCHSQSQID